MATGRGIALDTVINVIIIVIISISFIIIMINIDIINII